MNIVNIYMSNVNFNLEGVVRRRTNSESYSSCVCSSIFPAFHEIINIFSAKVRILRTVTEPFCCLIFGSKRTAGSAPS